MKTKLTTSGFLLMMSACTQAQIIHSPPPGAAGHAIPAMGGYFLLALCAVLLYVAKRAGFGSPKGLNAIVSLCIASALVSAALGGKIVADAHADGGGTVFSLLSSPNGGSVPIRPAVLNVFENTSGIVQRIDNVIPGVGCDNLDSGLISGTPRCTIGLDVSTGMDGMCYTDCRDIPD